MLTAAMAYTARDVIRANVGNVTDPAALAAVESASELELEMRVALLQINADEFAGGLVEQEVAQLLYAMLAAWDTTPLSDRVWAMTLLAAIGTARKERAS